MKAKETLQINDRTRTARKSDGTILPVVDSKLSTVAQPNEEDIKNGVPGDPTRCMYALCFRRMLGSEWVWVTRTVAYVELRAKGGKPYLARMIPSPVAKSNLKDFDDLQQMSPEAVCFEAPKGSRRLDRIRAAYQRWKERKTQASSQAYVKGLISPKPPLKDHHHPKPFDAFLRAKATGKFQFSPTSHHDPNA